MARFRIGDHVTRDGSDVHEIAGVIGGSGCYVVVCLVAPIADWVAVGKDWIADDVSLDFVTPEDESRIRGNQTRTP